MIFMSTGVYLKKLYSDRKQILLAVDPKPGVYYEINFWDIKRGLRFGCVKKFKAPLHLMIIKKRIFL